MGKAPRVRGWGVGDLEAAAKGATSDRAAGGRDEYNSSDGRDEYDSSDGGCRGLRATGQGR